MARLRIVHLVVIVITVFETLVQASYYLDDTDSSITYEGYWEPVSASIIDGTKLYNGTSMYGQVDSKHTHCTMAIPFNGSGITLYSMIAGMSVFNVSIDGGPPTSYHTDGVLGCCTSTIQPLFNYTLYSVSSLPLGNHILLLTLLESFANDAGQIWPDYAFVDAPDKPKPTASTSDVHPSTIDSSAKSKSRSVIGPAIGGAVGGILAITIAILIWFWKRRQRRGHATPSSPDAKIHLSNVDRRPVVGGTYLPSSPIIYPDPNIEVDRAPIVGGNHSSSDVSPSILPTRPWPNLIEQPNLPPSANRSSKVNDVILTPPDPSTTSDGALAAQEARFLRHLYDRNAPAEEIAELMEAMQMRARAGADAGMAVSNAEHPDIAPPAYGSDSEVIR